MTLSKQEKKYAIGVVATIVLVVLYEVVISPYSDSLDTVNKGYADATHTWVEDNQLFDRRSRLKKVWTEITDGGLTSDESKAESQALSAASDWASAAGVTITAQKTERATDALPFQIIRFRVTGTGSTPAIARLLYSFETATIPVRVDDIQITPRKEGTDDLTIQMSVSTLCLKPDADASNKPTITRADGEVQSWN